MGGASGNYLTSAQRLQNKIARWVTGQSKKTKIVKLLEECGWLSIREMARYHTVVQLWKIVRLNRPLILTEKFNLTDDNRILTTIPRLQFTYEGFRWRASDQWNQLPDDLRGIKSLPAFKRRVKVWIKTQRHTEPD